MKSISTIQNNILKMISQYVGKKYIYILPIAYQDHEEDRNFNDWENRVNEVLTSCNIPCFITYGNYKATDESYGGAREYERAPMFMFFCEPWQVEEFNCIIRTLSTSIEQQHYFTINLNKMVSVAEMFKNPGVFGQCEVREISKWSKKEYPNYFEWINIFNYKLVDIDINPRVIPNNFIKLDHHLLLAHIDDYIIDCLDFNLFEKNLSLENYLSKAGLVNYKVIYESEMPEGNHLLEIYRIIDLKEIPEELRLIYAIKLAEIYPLDSYLFEFEEDLYISIVSNNRGFYYYKLTPKCSGNKYDERYGSKQKSLIKFYLCSYYNLQPSIKYAIKCKSCYVSIIERNNVSY